MANTINYDIKKNIGYCHYIRDKINVFIVNLFNPYIL